jgi:CRISPR-associated protein Cmr6
MIEALRESLTRASSGPRSHAGLILDRYSPHAVGKGAEDSRKALFESARRAVETESTISIYKAAMERWKSSFFDPASFDPKLSPRILEFVASSTVLIGLGGDHATETGLTIHHTYGVPYIPGTAVKGLAAHYAHQVWGASDTRWRMATDDDPKTGELHATMFGTSVGELSGGGLIDFSDGWIASPKGSLVPDVMTPHHGDYYMASDDEVDQCPPTDFDNPVPVTFLSAKGTFFIAISKRDRRLPDEWVDRAEELVKRSLQEWGIGGKTSADYGRMEFRGREGGLAPSSNPATTNTKKETLPDLPAPLIEQKPKMTVTIVKKPRDGKAIVRLPNGDEIECTGVSNIALKIGDSFVAKITWKDKTPIAAKFSR